MHDLMACMDSICRQTAARWQSQQASALEHAATRETKLIRACGSVFYKADIDGLVDEAAFQRRSDAALRARIVMLYAAGDLDSMRPKHYFLPL